MLTDLDLFILASIVVGEKSESSYFVGCFPPLVQIFPIPFYLSFTLYLKAFYIFLFVLSIPKFLQAMSRGGFIITILINFAWYCMAIPNSRHSCFQFWFVF